MKFPAWFIILIILAVGFLIIATFGSQTLIVNRVDISETDTIEKFGRFNIGDTVTWTSENQWNSKEPVAKYKGVVVGIHK